MEVGFTSQTTEGNGEGCSPEVDVSEQGGTQQGQDLLSEDRQSEAV